MPGRRPLDIEPGLPAGFTHGGGVNEYWSSGCVLQITPCERLALQLLANGHSRSELGAGFGISTPEIETMLSRLFASMGAATEAEAVAAAHRRGLLTGEPAGSQRE
jgi:DNA-binding CsgD family transcriptional regulator